MRRASVRNNVPPILSIANIDPFAAGQRLHPFAHVLGRSVDDMLGAAVARRLSLGGRSDSCNDAAAKQTRDFDTSQADAAGGARDQNGLAGLQPRALGQRVPRGEIGVENGRSDDEIDIVGDARALRGFGDHALGKAAKPISAGDAVAAAKALDLVADGDDDSGCVGSRDIGEGWPQLIPAANHQIVHIADGGCMNVDHDFVVSRPRFGRLAKSQRADSVEALAKHRAHGRLINGLAHATKSNPAAPTNPCRRGESGRIACARQRA